MYKVFYKKETGQVMGFSDGEESMEHPFIETDVAPILLSNYYVDVKAYPRELKAIKESFTDEEWAEIISPKPIQLIVEESAAEEEIIEE